MKVFIFGSCRVWNTLENINFIKIQNKNYRTLMHSIGQYNQEIDFINKKIDINPENYEYMYYSNYYNLLIENKENLQNNLFDFLNNSDYIIAEMQTLKFIEKDNLELDMVQCQRKPNNFEIKAYNKTILINKINEFIKKLPNKKIIFIGHVFDESVGIKKINTRLVINNLVKNIVNNKNTFFINPSNVFKNNKWNDIMKDSSHYTIEGEKIIKEYIESEIKKIIS